MNGIIWSENCGWEESVEVIVFISFLLLLIENSEYLYPTRIVETLNDIYDFITDGKDYSKHCLIAERGYEIWASYDKIEWSEE